MWYENEGTVKGTVKPHIIVNSVCSVDPLCLLLLGLSSVQCEDKQSGAKASSAQAGRQGWGW